MARFLVAGNVKTQPLADIFASDAWRQILAQIPSPSAVCVPECNPGKGDGSDCAPAETEACGPTYEEE